MTDHTEQHSPETQNIKYSLKAPITSSAVAEEARPDLGNTTGSDLEHGRDQNNAVPESPYSAFTEREKIATILMVSWMALISPLSSSVYFPALDDIAESLHVSITKINLTITTYQIFQALAPSFIGNFADIRGRRPAYVICFTIYFFANLGLALQDSYAALMVLRCLQSAGSSGTIALGSAAVADLSTRAERGKYIAYASMGVTLGPAIGPLVGGLLDTYLGWHSIFWFLVIFSGIMFLIMLAFLPETCRAVVGNGSIAPPKWNMSVVSYLQQRRQRKLGLPAKYDTVQAPTARRPLNPLATLKVARNPEILAVLVYSGLLYAGYFAVLSTLSTQLTANYHLSPLKVGLCFIPLGVGSITSRWTLSNLLDRNYHRHARKAGVEIIKNKQQRLSDIDVERARLTISLPIVYASCCIVVAYAWMMQYRVPLAALLVVLFIAGNLFSGALNTLSVLVVDLSRDSPATATAAMNLFRCLLGAAASGVSQPLIDAIGTGWTGTLIAGIWLMSSPLLWVVRSKGFRWRREEKAKREERDKGGEEAERRGGGGRATGEIAGIASYAVPVVADDERADERKQKSGAETPGLAVGERG